MALPQDAMSFVSQHQNRIHKNINEYDVYNDPVGPFEEGKVLKFISSLSTAFPQNISIDGPYKLSYDYIDAVPLKVVLDGLSPDDVKTRFSIFSRIFQAYYILYEQDFYHGDTNKDNYLMDKNGKLYIIDFGLAFSVSRPKLSVPPLYLPKFGPNGHDGYQPTQEEINQALTEPSQDYQLFTGEHTSTMRLKLLEQFICLFESEWLFPDMNDPKVLTLTNFFLSYLGMQDWPIDDLYENIISTLSG